MRSNKIVRYYQIKILTAALVGMLLLSFRTHDSPSALFRPAGPQSILSLSVISQPALFSPPATKPDVHTQPKELLIAAAADLRFAMDSLLVLFRKEAPETAVKVVYGSSGNFYEQIRNGAPFDLFFSADTSYPGKLASSGFTSSPVRSYGKGRIVLWSKKLDPNVLKMNALLDPSVTRIAIANPAHAPYGQRAAECLRYYKLYDKVQARLVMGENISQTAQFVSSGAADIGIIALSLAVSPAMQQEKGKYWLIPQESHQPLQQGFVILQHGRDNPKAVKLANFIGTPKAKAVLQYFGLGEK